MTESAQPQAYYSDDEIDLRELFATLWRGKWIILLFTIVFAAGGVAYALSKPNIYQATVLLAPAQDEGGAGGLKGQLGGLASLAGISIGGGGGASPTVIAKEVLQSRAFLRDFIHRHDLSVPLIAAKAWDDQNEEWVFDRDIYDGSGEQWLTDADGKSEAPTDWDMVKKFKKEHLSLSEDQDSGMITLTVKNLAPPAAKDWAENLVRDINEHMREQDVAEAEARIAYLEKKLSETNIAGMQQVFYQLIENETRTVMLANAQSEYVFKTIDPAVVPQEKSEPKRALICVVATMLGGMLGVLVVFIIAFVRSGNEEQETL
ncbi:Wzz/FepE/Etk N-terminal domain-containing protein [Marinobacter sp.]|uniref:Wzz/FepE/Etk N-terminal domain-containing protein n=1 Tax=Marinobacter sp. TaxID=50741 RepID=UPI003A8D85A8